MYPLFESIRVDKGQVYLLPYHQERLERSYLQFYKKKCPWSLEAMLPDLPTEGLFKIRFLYNDQSYSFEPVPYEAKTIQSLKLMEIDSYRYDLKYTDRSFLNQAFDQRANCDDVLLMRKGYLTDTSYCNIILFDGVNWITPAAPLFEGVQRSFLLDNEQVKTAHIHTDDLHSFVGFQLINALNPMIKNNLFPIQNIKL